MEAGFLDAEVSRLGFRWLVDDISIVVTELVNNATVHAGTGCELALYERHGKLRLTVHDRSPFMPERRPVSVWWEGGRGLGVVETLCDGWGAASLPWGGKVVWAELDVLAASLANVLTEAREAGTPLAQHR